MPGVILIRGKAGVGKSTLAHLLSAHLSVPLLQKDVIYDALYEAGISHEALNRISERILLTQLQVQIKNGLDVIVDNSYHYPSHFHSFRRWADQQNIHVKSVLLTCSNEAVWKKRFETRKNNPRPNHRITDFEALREHYGTLHTESFPDELVLNSIHDANQLLHELVRWLQHAKPLY